MNFSFKSLQLKCVGMAPVVSGLHRGRPRSTYRSDGIGSDDKVYPTCLTAYFLLSNNSPTEGRVSSRLGPTPGQQLLTSAPPTSRACTVRGAPNNHGCSESYLRLLDRHKLSSFVLGADLVEESSGAFGAHADVFSTMSDQDRTFYILGDTFHGKAFSCSRACSSVKPPSRRRTVGLRLGQNSYRSSNTL